ncbi:GFA family protein [Thalassobaculum sp.]|uniref:GFA family protein n=1 Tax=Thalassobaculum sp. TaxID=2022740 RepID=UPI0032F05FCB
MSSKLTGGCLCGSVRYHSPAEPVLTAHCHCADCRRSSGTGHCTHVVMPEAGFTVTGEVRFFDRPADSGNLVRRGFCPACGSPIYSTNSMMPDKVFIRASSLDDPELAKPAMSVYASRAPSWDAVDPALPAFAEMPTGGPKAAIPAA